MRRRGRGYSPHHRGGYRRTSSPDERERWAQRSRSPLRNRAGGEGGRERQDSSVEDRQKDMKKAKRTASGTGTISWSKSGDGEANKKLSAGVEDTDTSRPSEEPAKTASVVEEKAIEEKTTEEKVTEEEREEEERGEKKREEEERGEKEREEERERRREGRRRERRRGEGRRTERRGQKKM